MPKVESGGTTKHFSYTPKGKAAAQAFAKKVGGKMITKSRRTSTGYMKG